MRLIIKCQGKKVSYWQKDEWFVARLYWCKALRQRNANIELCSFEGRAYLNALGAL